MGKSSFDKVRVHFKVVLMDIKVHIPTVLRKVFKYIFRHFLEEFLAALVKYVGMLGVCGLCRRRWDQLTAAGEDRGGGGSPGMDPGQWG